MGLVDYTAISHPFAPHLDTFVFGGPVGDNVFLWALSILDCQWLPVRPGKLTKGAPDA